MPEGPSIVILRELLLPFEGQKVMRASGNAKIDMDRISGKTLEFCLSWGKHTLLCFDDFYLRIHFLMFGTYRINERKETEPRLQLKFKNDELNFYTCSVRLMEGTPLADYEWEADVMSDYWDAENALKKLQLLPRTALISDALLNQEIFSGVGNIIKNEILWRFRIHPESLVHALPEEKQREVVNDARDYSFLFYEWKKEYVLKKNWKIYKKGTCPRCDVKTVRGQIGKTPRLTTYCPNCQHLYTYEKGKSKKQASKKAV
jgi:endonuclease-8